MKKYNPLSFIKDEIIGSQNTFHAWCVLIATVLIVGIGFYLSSPDRSFHGIAGSRESIVNFESAVEIKRVHVIPGQRVQKGDLLIEVDQPDLNKDIRELTTEIEKLRAEKSARDQMNKAVGNGGRLLGADPLEVEIRELEENRAALERQRNNLYVFAEIDGIVGSVNFKRGERAAAFSPLVTVSPDTPTFVQGFVNEQMRTNVHPGSHVRISSLTNAGVSVEGKVISVGARFIEVPYRLVPNGRASGSGPIMWGREVMVEIPKENQILLGEKVQIAPVLSLIPALVAHADEELPGETKVVTPTHVRVPPSLSDRSAFEASGAVYLSDLRKYLVVSDDTDANDSPWLYLMSEDGEVDERPLVIPNLKKVKDLESISVDGDYTYILSSLNNKDAKPGSEEAKTRNQMIRMKRSGFTVSDTTTVDLGAILRKQIQASNHPLLRALTENGIQTLEVEAHTVRDGALFVGLKAPQGADNSSLILRIPNVNALFAKSSTMPELEVWKSVKFDGQDDSSYRISDMTFVGNTAYFTTSCKHDACGAFWSLSDNETRPRLVQGFKNDSPEGVAYNATKNIFLITFDLGSRGSKVATMAGPRTGK